MPRSLLRCLIDFSEFPDYALDLLEQALASDSQMLGWLGMDRAFDPLRPAPRTAELLRRLGLESAREETGQMFVRW